MNRRQIGEESYRKEFKEFGLSDRFEFIKRDWDSYKGRKIFVRCKSCGMEFLTWGFAEIRKGRQSHLVCSECGASSDGNDVWNRSPKCDEAMAYYVEGHTVNQTAQKFGVSVFQINNAVKSRGLSNGRDWREGAQQSNLERSKQASILFAERIANGELHMPKGGNVHKRRAVKYGCAYDYDVTLQKLIKRNGLRCGICGELCNQNDNKWGSHFGPTSPTIDHIIPMSRSGGHVWNNVQVAHAICNSKKCDKVEQVV